ncbi:hypothetical protein ElyMa_004047200 [Elysia marginata]|uniref:Uncharacterized protein n=1 Tax=Elysia marginata TaxID=1093978 RepID=A0AAV4G7C0_9GAST|nr:hypothetical protein ElyMa_004047200 [Elysia marginata]
MILRVETWCQVRPVISSDLGPVLDRPPSPTLPKALYTGSPRGHNQPKNGFAELTGDQLLKRITDRLGCGHSCNARMTRGRNFPHGLDSTRQAAKPRFESRTSLL